MKTLSKTVLIAASMMLAGLGVASAQNAGPTYSNTIHQSAGDRDSRGTPKYYQSERSRMRHTRVAHAKSRATTGAGSGPYYSNTIHQSAGDRDSRGNLKYNKEK